MVGAQLHPLTRFPYRPRDCGTKARVRQARRSRIRVSWNWGVSYDVAMAAAGEGRGISSRFCYRLLIDTDLAIADAVSLLGRRQRLIITFSCNGVSRVTWQAAAGKRGGGTQKACCTRSSVRIVHFLQNGATGAYYRLLSVRTCVNTHKTIRYHTTGHHTTRNSHLKPLPVQHDIIARRHRSHCWSAGRRRGRAPRSPQ